jgi:mannose-6-phosphate isomerase-like protein (cupin superfamily)
VLFVTLVGPQIDYAVSYCLLFDSSAVEADIMLINSESQCTQFVANDGCRIRELLHPKNDNVALDFSLAIAEVEPDCTTYRHRLAQAEVYYLIEGTGIMHVDNEVSAVVAGDAVLIPPGCVQWIENSGKQTLKFAAIVAPAWSSDGDARLESAISP